jgi:hypothetical protein
VAQLPATEPVISTSIPRAPTPPAGVIATTRFDLKPGDVLVDAMLETETLSFTISRGSTPVNLLFIQFWKAVAASVEFCVAAAICARAMVAKRVVRIVNAFNYNTRPSIY